MPTPAASSIPSAAFRVHEDRDNDGKYEHHSIFVDKLVFPRFVMPFGAGSVLTMESNADEVWKFTDTNNDGVAEKKELFATGFGRLANVEHQQASLFWAMDNWMYSTVNAFRVRWTPGGTLVQEPTGGNGAQWGAVAGQLRKGVVPGRRERHARVLPAADSLRQFHGDGSVRAEPQHHVGGSGVDRRHAGRSAVGAPARTVRSIAPPARPATTSSAAIACRPTWSATTSTAKPSPASSDA